jgi:pimeloyl-ACP methyl ester carboxylesterase
MTAVRWGPLIKGAELSYFTAPDGTELFYRDYGAGRPVLFIHSMLMSSDMWQPQMLHLAGRGFRAVAYDRRGHGRSDDAGKGYDFDTLADDLAQWRPARMRPITTTAVGACGHGQLLPGSP